MKAFTYLIGLLSSMALVAGWGFGILHLPGASELSIYGLLGVTLVFSPLFTLDYLKKTKLIDLVNKLKVYFGLTSTLLIGVSMIFKILHLQGAPTVLGFGVGLFVFGFLPFLFFTMYKKSVS